MSYKYLNIFMFEISLVLRCQLAVMAECVISKDAIDRWENSFLHSFWLLY